MRILTAIIAGLAGLAFGSFLNVCLTRWTAGESVVRPRSHCRRCRRTLTWWENIPLVSYLLLRGRCRTCGARIGVRYLVVEAAVGGLWALVAYRSIPSEPVPAAALWYQALVGASLMIFIWLLVALAVLDAEHLWLPDWLTWPGIVLGVVRSVAMVGLGLLTYHYPSAAFSGRSSEMVAAFFLLYGLILAPALLWLIRWIYWLIRRREGLGMGDVKLMAMLGAWLGLPNALLALLIGVILGGIAAVVHLATRKPDEGKWATGKLPFGTFLSIGGIISALWGDSILSAYFRMAGFY